MPSSQRCGRELGKIAAQPGQFADQRGVIVFAAGLRPIHPANLVILAIGVVVAVLAVADLVARQQQRYALREEQACELITLSPPAHRENRRIVGYTFHAAIGAQIIVRSIAIVFAVGQIVLVLVADQVFEREAVVHGDVIDAAAGAAAVMLELHGRAGHAVGEIAGDIVVAAPEAAQGLAIDIVPFRPAVRKGADLVAAVTDVPGLGDQLDVAEHRILPDGAEERRVAVEGRLPAERGGEIEAEAIDVIRLDPHPQRIHDHLQHARVRELERIAGAGEIFVVARIVRRQPIVGGVVDAAIAQRRAHMVALAGVVVDHVEDDFDPGIVQRRDGGAEIADGVAVGVTLVRREEAQRIVAPIIGQAAVEQVAIVEERMDRQKFDRRDAEPAQVRNRGGFRKAAVSAARLRRHIAARLRQAFDVRLIEDGVFPRGLRPPLVRPGVRRVHHHGFGHAAGIVAPVEGKVLQSVPGAIARNARRSRRIGRPAACCRDRSDSLFGIEAVAGLRLIGAVHAIAVKLAGSDVRKIDVPDVVGAFRHRDALGLALALAVEQAQFDLGGIGGKQREIGSAPVPGRTERVGSARRDASVRSSGTRKMAARGGTTR